MRKPPSLTPKLLALTLGLCSAIPALADFYPIPLTPGSFNKDIVVEKTASPPAQMLVTANLDAGTNLAGIAAGGGTGGNQNSMYEIGFGTTAGTGLPFHGTLFNAQSNTTHHFRMPADYTTNNAIFVGGSGTVVTQVVNGSFALNTPAAYTHLSVLATAGSGPTRLVYYVNYSDGSQDANFFDVPDYLAQTGASVTNNTAWVCNGDFRGLDGSFQQVNSAPQQIRLYFNDIPLSFPSSLVTNIQFVYYTGGRAAIFGLSGSTDNGATFNPIGVSGYNADMVIEAPLATAVTATVDNGLLLVTNPNRGDNNTWYEVGFDLLQPANTWTGIPVHGSTFTAWSNANYTFTMPPSYTANDALMVGRDGFTNGTLTLASPAIYTNLAVLHAGNGYMGSNFYTIHHADASVETGVMTNFDWFQASDTTGPSNPSNKVAYVTAGRVATGRINVINNGGSLTAAKLFWVDLPVNNTSSAVTSVDITYGGVQGNRTHIFALSGSDGTSVANTPIALSPSSYNVDVVVEASAVTNMDSRAYTSATMDGGTNNNANTWYEQGWNKLAPLSGLPPAGTIISSTNLADHHYVMPATYVGPNAVYCDSNNPTASITFASPTNVLALSFLSANANQEIQIRVVINHLTSPAETNVFTSWDWFRQTGYPIPAYTVNGRVSTDTKSLNNFLPGTSNPNLLEAQFALQNTTDPVTGASFTWTTNNGLGAGSSTSSRFVILAVSGTTNLVAPILTLNPLGTNVFEGSNVVLTAGISGGTPPITFEWRKGTNAVYGAALANGGTISGATTPTLTFTSIGWSNSGDYVFIARGTGGATTSSVATVNAYSTLPAVTVPSDPISIYQPNGGTTPAANGVTHAIDRVANASYVNGGQNNGAPFVGPIGFVVAPRFGKSTVSAVRLYSADVNPQNDPADWTLEGSNDGGSSWTTIHSINFAANGLSLPAARNTTAGVTPLTQVVREIHFANSAGYTSYRVSFLHTTNDSVATALGIGEVELLGTNTPTAPLLVQQPRNVQVWPGGNPQFTVLATGFPTNLTYVWKRGGSPISGASQSSYTLLNAQVADSGATFSCTVANSNGNTNSASATLTVAGTAPTQSYPSAIITDHPVSYWRLGEADTGYPNNTVIAHDYFGGLDGTYSNAVLAATGYNPLVDTDTAATFGTQTFPPDNSYVDNIQGINFATPTNTSGAFSIETWVLNGQAGGQISGAGIVTKGFGGGGEQFALDTGAPGARFRFFVRDSSGATLGGNANGTVGPTNEVGPFAISNPNGGNWHHVVGVVDEANSNIVLYVDGISNAAGAAYAPGRGILPSPWPVTIGSRQPNLNLDYTNQFIGTIDDVAIYNYALSPAQVLNHYLAAHPLPIFTLRPTNTDFSDGGSLVLYSAAYGPSVTFQWHQSPDQSTWSAVGGQTSPTFNSPSTPNTFGPFVEVVATGSYGATTSSIVQVTVHSGAPVILQDLIPTNVVYASGSISLPVVAYGTAPVTFQWYKSADDITYTPVSNSGRISGANTNVLTISGSLGSDTGFYKVTISNGSGSVDSVHQYLLVQGQAMFNNTGLGWRFNSTENPPVNGGVSNSISGNVFTPTDGTAGENRSVWYGTPLYIGAFQASFTYQDVGVNGADGSAFVIQNQGPTALGGAGGGIGYSGITPSVALMLDIFQTPAGQNLANGGVLLDVNGLAISTPGNLWYPPGSVNIRGGNPIDVNVKYLNGIITATLRDTVANTTFTTNAVINIPSIVGANTALVGFTGSEGGTSSHQAISNFVFTPLTPLTTKLTSTNTVVLTWPALIGGYALQSTPSLSPQSWSNVANPVTQVSGQNQVIIPVSAANAFYRLSLQ